MILSRFWILIIVIPIAWLIGSLFTGRIYALDFVVNGEKDSATMVVGQQTVATFASPLKDSLLRSGKSRIRGGDGLYYQLDNGIVTITRIQKADGILPTCRNALKDLWLPLLAYMTFFSGLMHLMRQSGANERLARWLSPFFVRIFPDIPEGHPAISSMTLNFAANFLGLDSAATPFGLKAMEELQELNKEHPDVASNAQIMFLSLHAAGMTLIPTSIIGYRAAAHAQNPTDVVLPCIITSFVGTLAALVIVGIRQRIKLLVTAVMVGVGLLAGLIAALLAYISSLTFVEKGHFTSNLSNGLLLVVILGVLIYSFRQEKKFSAAGTDIFGSFVGGGREGFKVGVNLLPYILGMLVAISLFRNSGLFDAISNLLSNGLGRVGVREEIVHAIPVALLRPFNSAGSRGFLLDAMSTYHADSFTGRLVCVFQCAAETTFYVVAVYFGSVKISKTRYTLGAMLLVDLICVFVAIFVCRLFFPL